MYEFFYKRKGSIMEELITLEEAVEHVFTNSDLNSNKSVALLGGLFRADAGISKERT